MRLEEVKSSDMVSSEGKVLLLYGYFLYFKYTFISPHLLQKTYLTAIVTSSFRNVDVSGIALWMEVLVCYFYLFGSQRVMSAMTI